MKKETITKIIVWSIIGFVTFVAITFGALGPGCASYNRWQKREDAHNKVQVVKIEIQKAEEEARVNQAQVKATEAEARKRVAEAVGIKKAQVEINKTLTPLYVQHEYVQAIEKGHVETTFIPVGPNGIPFVGNILENSR
jgi:hypothetical protein